MKYLPLTAWILVVGALCALGIEKGVCTSLVAPSIAGVIVTIFIIIGTF